MGNYLIEPGEEELPRIVLHPEQLRAVDTVASLIADLRDAKNDPARVYDMEARLFRARYPADEAWMSARRAVTRVERQGKSPDFTRPRRDDVVEFIAFNAYTTDMAARDPALAPYSIYPLPPEICAQLICDQVARLITISFDAIHRALDRPGADIRIVANAPTTGLLDGGAPVVQIRHRDRRLTVPMSAIKQLLLEFIDTKRWAEAVWDLIETADTKHAVLTSMNERAAWA